MANLKSKQDDPERLRDPKLSAEWIKRLLHLRSASSFERPPNATIEPTANESEPQASIKRIASFLDLPGEIRNQIYEMVCLPYHSTIIISFLEDTRDVVRRLFKSPIHRISKQIRAESISFLCTTKVFYSFTTKGTLVFLDYIRMSGRQSLSFLKLKPLGYLSKVDCKQLSKICDLLQDCSGLKYLEIAWVTLEKRFADKEQEFTDVFSAFRNLGPGVQRKWVVSMHEPVHEPSVPRDKFVTITIDGDLFESPRAPFGLRYGVGDRKPS